MQILSWCHKIVNIFLSPMIVFSQNEFIELVGFDDIPEENSTSTKAQNKRERRRSKKEKEG